MRSNILNRVREQEKKNLSTDTVPEWVYESDTARFLRNSGQKKTFFFPIRKLQDTCCRSQIKGFVQICSSICPKPKQKTQLLPHFQRLLHPELKPEARPVPVDPRHSIAPADGKFWLENINIDNLIQVKGSLYP
jgi:hypothetical protein